MGILTEFRLDDGGGSSGDSTDSTTDSGGLFGSVEQTWNDSTPDLGGVQQTLGDFTPKFGANEPGSEDDTAEKARQRGSFGTTVDEEPRAPTLSTFTSTAEGLYDAGANTGEGFYTNNLDAAEGLYNAGKNTGGAVKGAGEGVYNLATGKESAADAASGAGRTIVSAATGGNVEEWRRKLREQEAADGNPLSEERDNIQRELKYGNDGGGDVHLPVPFTDKRLRIGGGTVSTVSSFNTAARVGFDAMLDSPTGPNVQDAGTEAATGSLSTYNKAMNTLTGSTRDEDISKQDFADTAESAQEDLNEFNKGLGRGYTDVVNQTPLKDNWAAQGGDELVGTGFEWLAADPVEGTLTATTGVDAETGETEARAEPADLVDAMAFGFGKALKGVTKGLKTVTKSDEVITGAAKTGDETVATADDITQTTTKATDEAGSTSSSLAALSALGAAVFGGGKGLRKMGKYSWLDEFVTKSDEVATGSTSTFDEVSSGIDDTTVGSLDTIDEFDSLSRSTGTGDDAFRFTEDLRDTSSIMDEGTSAVKTGDETSIDDVLSMSFDEFSDETLSLSDETTKTDDLVSTFDEGGDSLTSTFDELFSGTDDALDDATLNTVKTGDEFTSTSLADETLSLSDEGGSTLDEGGSTLDEGGSTLDEGGSFIDTVGDTFRGWWDDLGWEWKYGLPSLLGGGLVLGQFTDIGLDDGNDGRRDPGPQGKERPIAEPVKTYDPAGILYEVLKGSDSTEWKTLGYAIYLGKDEKGRWLSPGTKAMLDTDARPAKAEAIAGEGTPEWVPKPRFGTIGEADDTYERFLAWLKEEAPPEPDTPDTPPAPGVDGRLTAPDAVGQGEGFEATWEATLTGTTESMSSRLTLGIPVKDSIVPLAESDMTLGGGQSSDAGTFTVQTGWPAVAPGSYEMHALVMQNGSVVGSLAKTTIEVTPTDEADKSKEGSAWGDPTLVKELPHGWFLLAQVKEDGSKETRFMVVGRREDGTYIYLHSDGRARTSPDFYGTVEQAAAAFKRWVKRAQSGAAGPDETPSTKSGRPDPAQVKKDAAATDENSTQGLIGRLARAAKKNPVLFAGGTATTLLVVYYMHREGYLSGALPEVNL